MKKIALLCPLLSVLPFFTHAEDGNLTANLGLDFSSGNYGSQTKTEIWSVPFSLKYRRDLWTLRVSTSWLRVQGAGNVTPDGDPLDLANTPSTTEGMGDIITSLTYELADARRNWAGLDISGKVKFGTASTEKHLGTGKNDYTLKVETYKSINKWTPFFNVGYKWKGDPDTIIYRNVWLGSTGVDYRITPTLSVGGSYDWQQAVTATSSITSEAMVYLNIRLNNAYRLNIYTVTGFSNASPDWGSGVMLSHRF